MTGFDQAHKLRNAIIKKAELESVMQSNPETDPLENNTRVICISSGKGGVGKSNFTINLALAIKSKGKRVVVIDADLGLANIEILIGIIPRYSLLDVLKNNLNIEDIITEGPEKIGIISGGSGIQSMSELSTYELNKLLTSISRLKNLVDYILIDTGAGISKAVTSFIEAANELIVITTPEPPAIADAYALIKILSSDKNKRKISLVVNKAASEKEGKEIFSKIQLVSSKFLKMDLHYLGFIYTDDNVLKSVKDQKPFYTNYPKTKAKNNIDIITRQILEMDVDAKSFNNFVNKLKGIFLNGGKYGR